MRAVSRRFVAHHPPQVRQRFRMGMAVYRAVAGDDRPARIHCFDEAQPAGGPASVVRHFQDIRCEIGVIRKEDLFDGVFDIPR